MYVLYAAYTILYAIYTIIYTSYTTVPYYTLTIHLLYMCFILII